MRTTRRFTLIELIVAMGVFTMLMAALMQFFGSAQKLWIASSSKTETFENARTALEMISKDIQSIYYEKNYSPFYAAYNSTPTGEKRISFITYTNNAPDNTTSRICKVQYYLNTSAADRGLYIYIIGNNKSSGSSTLPSDCSTYWDFYGATVNGTNQTFGNSAIPIATEGNATGYYVSEIIPYVVDFKVDCFKESDPFNVNTSGNPMCTPEFPYAIQVSISVMSKTDFAKWKTLGYSTTVDVYSQRRTFTKRIVIGDRGQYD